MHGTRTTAMAATVVMALAGAAVADSWMPPVAERFVDGRGDYHVIVSPTGAFTYARRGAENEPVTHRRDDESRWSESKIDVRDGDRNLATGSLPHRPMRVAVSSTGRGFVALDHYARCGYGEIAVVVDGAGKTVHRLTLARLFPDTNISDAFTHSVSSIWWLGGAWIDDDDGSAVIVANGGLVRVLDLATGETREGGADDLVRALAHPSAEARNLALELIREKQVGGVEAALVRIVDNPETPTSTRLRVAVILAERGDPRGRPLVAAAAAVPLPDGVSKDDHEYAVANLPVVLGEEAMPLLRDLMRGPAGDAWHAAQRAFASLEEKAVPTLLAMLAEAEATPDYRGGAAHALREIGSPDSLDGLLAAVGDANEYTANAAANAAIAIGGKDCAEALLAHLVAGCTQDGRIAMSFEDVKYAAAVPALIDLLERSDKDGFDRGRAVDALQFQTGRELGDDVAAWKAWLRDKPR